VISFGTILFLVLIAMVIVAAWPTCKTTTSRYWLIVTMGAAPWLAWLYWVPRAVHYRLTLSKQRRQVAVGQHYRASVYFWLERQRDGTPVEQAIAPQMLAFLRESAPSGLAGWTAREHARFAQHYRCGRHHDLRLPCR
jgi:4-amino-4-deoxy-L-arabinose transferase-like glycosyltransferase